MFEDSMMESGGQIKTKSKYWMIATFGLNAAILATMILIPLIYPEALPKNSLTASLSAPPPPPQNKERPNPPPRPRAAAASAAPSSAPNLAQSTKAASKKDCRLSSVVRRR